MSKTIELMELIGQDAALRHASQEDLARALDALNASEGLKAAAASGDKSRLEAELGHQHQPPIRVNHNDGGCDPYEDDTENEPNPNGDEADKTPAPSGS
jgi:hypothetical protein